MRVPGEKKLPWSEKIRNENIGNLSLKGSLECNFIILVILAWGFVSACMFIMNP